MPEFHLIVDGPVAGVAGYFELDAFTQGYIEAMFFTETSPAFTYADIEDDRAAWEEAEREGQSDGSIPGDAGYADLDASSLRRIIEDCQAFQTANARLLRLATTWSDRKGGDYDMTRAGHDYWYTRNGHGVGYWDRGLGRIGDMLADACRYQNVDVYLGDDNKVHIQ